jgi:hypothetical protein
LRRIRRRMLGAVEADSQAASEARTYLWLLQEKGRAILRMAEFVRGIIDTYRGIRT